MILLFIWCRRTKIWMTRAFFLLEIVMNVVCIGDGIKWREKERKNSGKKSLAKGKPTRKCYWNVRDKWFVSVKLASHICRRTAIDASHGAVVRPSPCKKVKSIHQTTSKRNDRPRMEHAHSLLLVRIHYFFTITITLRPLNLRVCAFCTRLV